MTKKKIVVKSPETQERKETIDVLFKVVDGNPPAHIADTNLLRAHLVSLKHRIDSTHMELAGCLEYAYEVGAYKDWQFDSWKEYVETELEISLRKAEYLQRNWRWFANIIKDASVRKKVEELGWTKASLLVGVVDETNADEWIDAAKQSNRDELKKLVKEAKEKDSKSGTVKPGAIEVFSNMTFRLTLQQKENVEEALDLAANMAESEKTGNLLDLVCSSFLADNRFQVAPGQTLLRHYLSKIEAILGARFIVVDPNTLDIVMGGDVFRKLAGVRDEEE